jgi:hypothetical protein
MFYWSFPFAEVILKSLHLALPAALCVAFSFPALAESRLLAVPAGQHLLAFSLPEGFEPVAEAGVLARRPGETAETWTEVITLTVDETRAAQDPSMDISMLGGVFQEQCPDTLEQTYFGSVDVPGSERGAYSGWNSCGTVLGSDPARSEELLSVAVSGPSGMYVLGWGLRGAAIDDRMDIDDELLEARLKLLTTGIRVCPVVAGEAAPYPSCIGG